MCFPHSMNKFDIFGKPVYENINGAYQILIETHEFPRIKNKSQYKYWHVLVASSCLVKKHVLHKI